MWRWPSVIAWAPHSEMESRRGPQYVRKGARYARTGGVRGQPRVAQRPLRFTTGHALWEVKGGQSAAAIDVATGPTAIQSAKHPSSPKMARVQRPAILGLHPR